VSTDPRSEFQSLLQEASQGNFGFSDMLYCRDVLAGVMNKSKPFLDELFCKLIYLCPHAMTRVI
jgi:hypothetical protein